MLLRVCQSIGASPTRNCFARKPSPRRVDAGIGQKRDTSTKPVDELQTNKGRKVVREFYDSDTEKAYVDGLVLIYSVSFNPACPQFYSTHFASLDTPGPLLHRSALTSTFIDIWNSIDRTSFLYHSSRASCRTSFIVIVTTTV